VYIIRNLVLLQNTIENIDVRDFASGVYYMRFRIADEFHQKIQLFVSKLLFL